MRQVLVAEAGALVAITGVGQQSGAAAVPDIVMSSDESISSPLGVSDTPPPQPLGPARGNHDADAGIMLNHSHRSHFGSSKS